MERRDKNRQRHPAGANFLSCVLSHQVHSHRKSQPDVCARCSARKLSPKHRDPACDRALPESCLDSCPVRGTEAKANEHSGHMYLGMRRFLLHLGVCWLFNVISI